MNDNTNSEQSMQRSESYPSFAKCFKRWFLFAFCLASTLVILQSIVKLPERIDQSGVHWFFGRQSGVYYIAIRLILIFAVSLLVAVGAAFSCSKTPASDRYKS
ncbi:MAG: hypothetical protein MUC83_09685 [Pirellula sp.]|nr:hypothetical protein [Pirellula sp.]